MLELASTPTRRRSDFCSASKTIPMPPRPISRINWKSPKSACIVLSTSVADEFAELQNCSRAWTASSKGASSLSSSTNAGGRLPSILPSESQPARRRARYASTARSKGSRSDASLLMATTPYPKDSDANATFNRRRARTNRLLAVDSSIPKAMAAAALDSPSQNRRRRISRSLARSRASASSSR